MLFFFFFQAEDGIRDLTVTGVQTCALPISVLRRRCPANRSARVLAPGAAIEIEHAVRVGAGNRKLRHAEIGRASCRERVWISGGAVAFEKKRKAPLHKQGLTDRSSIDQRAP